MTLRSLLFVAVDRPERFDKVAASGADALILDLEDAVAADRKAVARVGIRAALLKDRQSPALFVRINPLASAFACADLDALAGTRPEGIVLPKAEGRASVEALDAVLLARGLDGVPLLPIATETPATIFELGSYRAVSERLYGIDYRTGFGRMAAACRQRRVSPQDQDELTITGWAMEARLCAENPMTGFLPSTGP